jgi:hypothetical protein
MPDIEEDMQIMGIRQWRKQCKEREEWKRITGKAKTHSELQWRRKRKERRKRKKKKREEEEEEEKEEKRRKKKRRRRIRPIQACTGLDGNCGLQQAQAPRCQHNWHMKVARLTALHTGRLYPQGNIPGTHSC